MFFNWLGWGEVDNGCPNFAHCLTGGQSDHLGDLKVGQRCFGCLSRHNLGLDSHINTVAKLT